MSRRATFLKESTSGVRCSAMSSSAAPLLGSVVGPAFASGHHGLYGLPLTPGQMTAVTPFLADELDQLLRDEFARAGYDVSGVLRPVPRFDDARYYLPTLDELRAVVAARPTKGLGSDEDIFDCEDFAYIFRGFAAQHHFLDRNATDTLAFAVGLVWGRGFQGLNPLGHAVNFAVCSDRRVWFIDTSRFANTQRASKKIGRAAAGASPVATKTSQPARATSSRVQPAQEQELTPLTAGCVNEIHYLVI